MGNQVTTALIIVSILIGVTGLSLAINNSIKRKKERFSTSDVLTETSDSGAVSLSTIDLLSTLNSAINDANGPLFTYTARPGMIVMWYTDVAPPGWVICDGGTYNGMKTPDLRGRFPAGVFTENPEGTSYVNIGHNQYLGDRSTMLSIDNVPKHNHQISLQSMRQSGKDTECLIGPKGENYYSGANPNQFYTSGDGTIYAHDYTGPITTQKAVDIVPPCVGVYFIMKI